MSLIIAKKLESGFILVGDTKLTYPHFEKNNPKDGAIKSVIINSQLCISIAGTVDYGNEAIKIIGNGKPKDKVIEVLSQIHLQARHETEFLICFGEPHFELFSLKNGKLENVDTAWIGSQTAFDKYQYYLHSFDLEAKLRDGNTKFKIYKIPDFQNEESRQLYMQMLAALNLVIEDSLVPEVGGFVIPVAYEKNCFLYNCYFYKYRKPIVLKDHLIKNEWYDLDFGNATDGSYAVNFSTSKSSIVGVHFHDADIGLIYKRKEGGLMYPTLLSNVDEIDFLGILKEEDANLLFIKTKHSIGDFGFKACKKLKEGELHEAIVLFNRGLETLNTKIKFLSRNTALNILDLETPAQLLNLSSEEKNNLKQTFFNRGLALKELQNLNDAILDFNQALLADGNFLLAIHEKGNTLFQLNMIKEALVEMTRIVEISPSESSYYNRGVAFLKAERYDEAESDFNRSLSFNKNYQNAIVGLSEVKKRKATFRF